LRNCRELDKQNKILSILVNFICKKLLSFIIKLVNFKLKKMFCIFLQADINLKKTLQEMLLDNFFFEFKDSLFVKISLDGSYRIFH
jgi:hypothetical protein